MQYTYAVQVFLYHVIILVVSHVVFFCKVLECNAMYRERASSHHVVSCGVMLCYVISATCCSVMQQMGPYTLCDVISCEVMQRNVISTMSIIRL